MAQRKPPSGQNPSIDDVLLSWVKSGRVDKMADYVRRGRVHAGLDDATLRARWVETLKKMVAAANDEAIGRRHRDYEMELRVRGLDPPTAEVREEIEAVARRLRQEQAAIERDPEARRAAEAAIDALRRDYLDKRSKAN